MANMNGNLNAGIARIKVNTKEFGALIRTRVDAAMLFAAADGTKTMKKKAPWTDRTGNARAGLFTKPSLDGDLKTILFSHTMSYGIWLEIIRNGKWQIIMPTVKYEGEQLMRTFRDQLFAKSPTMMPEPGHEPPSRHPVHDRDDNDGA